MAASTRRRRGSRPADKYALGWARRLLSFHNLSAGSAGAHRARGSFHAEFIANAEAEEEEENGVEDGLEGGFPVIAELSLLADGRYTACATPRAGPV